MSAGGVGTGAEVAGLLRARLLVGGAAAASASCRPLLVLSLLLGECCAVLVRRG